MIRRNASPEDLAAEQAALQAADARAAQRRQELRQDAQDRLQERIQSRYSTPSPNRPDPSRIDPARVEPEPTPNAARQAARERYEARLAELRPQPPSQAKLREEPEPPLNRRLEQEQNPDPRPSRQESAARASEIEPPATIRSTDPAPPRSGDQIPLKDAAPTARQQQKHQARIEARTARQQERTAQPDNGPAREDRRSAAKDEEAMPIQRRRLGVDAAIASTRKTPDNDEVETGRTKSSSPKDEDKQPDSDAPARLQAGPTNQSGNLPPLRQRTKEPSEEPAKTELTRQKNALSKISRELDLIGSELKAEARHLARKLRRTDHHNQLAEPSTSAADTRKRAKSAPATTPAEKHTPHAPPSFRAARRFSFVPGTRRTAPPIAPSGLQAAASSALSTATPSPAPADTPQTGPTPRASTGRTSLTPAPATVPSPTLFPIPAATALLRLSTTGAFITDDSGNAVSLRGVSVRGLDTLTPDQDAPTALSLDEDNLSLMRDVWGLNLVRIPFQAQTILSGSSAVGSDGILASLDQAIAVISQAGLYILLAIEAPPPTATNTAPCPDATTIQAWQTLAARYNGQNAVLYELFASTAPLEPTWPQDAQVLIGSVRAANQAALIFVGGGLGGVDLTHLPLLFPTGEPVFGLVYTIDVSPTTASQADDGALSAFAASYPVFASTWTEGDDRLAPYIADLFGRNGIGWAAANWNADPFLIADAANHDFTSTSWGLVAQRAAAAPAPQLLQPFIYAATPTRRG
jgi:hypothetical protein